MDCRCGSSDAISPTDLDAEVRFFKGVGPARKPIWDARMGVRVCISCGNVSFSMNQKERQDLLSIMERHDPVPDRNRALYGDAEKGNAKDRG
jgi:hypothetical protein